MPPRSLARRTLLRHGLPLLLVAAALAVAVAVAGPGGRERWLAGAGIGSVGVLGAAALLLAAREAGRAVDEAASSMGRGRAGVASGVAGTAEFVRLREALDGVAAEVGRRMRDLDEERRERDAVLSALEDGVVLVRGDEVVYANRAARELFGGTPARTRGLGPHALHRIVERAAATAAARVEEVHTGAGTILHAAAVPLEGGRVLLALRDVSEQRRVEAMRRDFVADASHELKTPVASIRAAAETVAESVRDDPEAAARLAARMARDAERLGRLVSDLLDLSRLETERPREAEVRLDRIARDAVEGVREGARAGQVTVDLDLAPVSVSADVEDLRLVVDNLLDNAIRYTPSGGRVRVEVRAAGDRAVLTVADTGMGIPSRHLPRIFERFYRVDPARSRETGGTGLGLAIARHVVDRHGGTIEAESELGRGSTFRVTLPTG